ncbi:hypothetical protein DUNSADRAFT_18205 [Dunaliella salina]|uniref:Uncharacterized protein n=1 Tax=Dunaliella salina TaxID=3046 RepID=A0ABQ7G0J8_DUNSA|nr:hypothetical protein DUNSADRAFT_18205 [Dunaliella salina]|eukprot:KAF5828095.1 hypothetical protein DUNSADRAFT_18205 [Dunaliella salina]
MDKFKVPELAGKLQKFRRCHNLEGKPVIAHLMVCENARAARHVPVDRRQSAHHCLQRFSQCAAASTKGAKAGNRWVLLICSMFQGHYVSETKIHTSKFFFSILNGCKLLELQSETLFQGEYQANFHPFKRPFPEVCNLAKDMCSLIGSSVAQRLAPPVQKSLAGSETPATVALAQSFLDTTAVSYNPENDGQLQDCAGCM